MTRDEFLVTMLEQAGVARDAGARINAPAAAAHAANESAFGRSALALQGFNLFGVKATGQHTRWWTGETISLPTWEVVAGKNVTVQAQFRRYETWAASFGDYGDVIARVYPAAAAAADRDVAFLHHLFLTGPRRWATDPLAFDKACRILAQYHEVLYPAGPVRLAELDTVVLHDVSVRSALEVAHGVMRGAPVVLRAPAVASVTNGRKLDVRWEPGQEEA